jgi:hypothetical protein
VAVKGKNYKEEKKQNLLGKKVVQRRQGDVGTAG